MTSTHDASSEHSFSDAVEQRIKQAIADSGKAIEELEADALGKGATLKLTGARYRIYDTKAPE